ncbi:YTH domain-containing protein 1-like isoform X2 [Macrobrachium nipponense]|uniref:YTH domain-containing protein 1-like isoform X2 n=1 Tax=Macrobrachium nipponense TaxID=159736 RepID=UPI0030C8146E
MAPLWVLWVATVLTPSSTLTSAALLSEEKQPEKYEGPLLSTFKGVNREFIQNTDGTYHFSFSLPQQDRYENRDADGKVTGSFSFVDNSGEEISVKYDADDKGFRPESDALPEIPEDTDDVQSAREQFLRYYEQTKKFLENLGSDEDSDDSSSSEESDEYDDNDEEDESDEEDDSDEDSDEEDSEEEEEEDEDEEEEEEGEEEEKENEEEEENANVLSFTTQRKSSSDFGRRIRQQDISRAAETVKQKRRANSRAVFLPFPIADPRSVFGRRTSFMKH